MSHFEQYRNKLGHIDEEIAEAALKVKQETLTRQEHEARLETQRQGIARKNITEMLVASEIDNLLARVNEEYLYRKGKTSELTIIREQHEKQVSFYDRKYEKPVDTRLTVVRTLFNPDPLFTDNTAFVSQILRENGAIVNLVLFHTTENFNADWDYKSSFYQDRSKSIAANNIYIVHDLSVLKEEAEKRICSWVFEQFKDSKIRKK